MTVARCVWRRVLVLLVSLAVLSPARIGETQEVAGPALKAAFLFNFVKFTTWPPDVLPDAAPLVMCVVNDPAIGSSLTNAVRGRAVLGHEIRVLQTDTPAGLRACHLLYVSGTRADALKAVAAVRQLPVFTVSDVQTFTTDGGVAQLHVQQGQLRFAIAADTARAARLQISSKLLTLARKP
jgi:hypothetical protein